MRVHPQSPEEDVRSSGAVVMDGGKPLRWVFGTELGSSARAA